MLPRAQFTPLAVTARPRIETSLLVSGMVPQRPKGEPE